jgi:alanine racemase
MAVIKADGYGHGIAGVASALASVAPKFAVACIEEALAIRNAGFEQQPVALLQGVHSEQDLATCIEHNFEPVLHCEDQLQWLVRAPSAPRIWLKVNTGMNRLGFHPEELAQVMATLAQSQLTSKVIGFVTHFACADDQSSAMTEQQTECFEKATAPWPELQRSVGNSAALFRREQKLFGWSRPGIMLYGASPIVGVSAAELGLKPAMTLQAPLMSTRLLQPGDSVGYGASWVAQQPTLMGMVALGYGDGYPRHAGTGTPAAVRGQRIQLIGRVSMDMLAVDLSAAPEACAGDLVELWGPTVPVDDVADHAGTIGYELLTGVTARVPRRWC